MGSGQSIFFPDNGHRRERADQLANDCRDFQHLYETRREELTNLLGPYKEKLDKVLTALGCSNIADLDRLVTESATGQVLQDWESVKSCYDTTQLVDQIIMGAIGTIAVAEIAISAIGALLGPIGFMSGIAVTSTIVLAIGVVGGLYEIINGAVQRSRLRDAINALFASRIKMKFLLDKLEAVNTWIVVLQSVYQVYEACDYDKDKIIEAMKQLDIARFMKEDQDKITYYSVAKGLSDMDSNRDSWRNEDPNWEELARALDTVNAMLAQLGANPVIMSNALVADHAAISSSVHQPEIVSQIEHDKCIESQMRLSIFAQNESPQVMDEPPPPYEEHVSVTLTSKDGEPLASALQGPLRVSLKDFADDFSAYVRIGSAAEDTFLVEDGGSVVRTSGTTNLASHPQTVDWLVSFAEPAEAKRFSATGQELHPNLEQQPFAEIRIGYNTSSREPLYVAADGSLVKDISIPGTVFVARYARVSV
ncbi:hypothetical protein CERSUDRAFT_111848 [Gelatoporia subvermispora B]|uniref:Uncharacterized protein n=1 Tax=Ceriporiopsis subvermispora (strain B) TaxID=914234 RepID=M2QR27_CERS8|nr:hypothetical protein CERSUDRAFT_111848 [Gelatoporia subvermispora B]